MKKFLYLLGFLLISSAIYVTFFSPTTALVSPLGSPLESRIKHLESKSYIVLGFAPYWNLKKISDESLQNITHFAYFHLLLNGDGTIYTHVNKKSEDPGYTNYKRLVAGTIDYASKPLILTFMPESQTALNNIVANQQSRQQTINTILSTLAEAHASGVNIDFEPVGNIDPSVQPNFTLFIKELRSTLESSFSNPESMLTISLYASAASKPRIWDLDSLAPLVDYFVVMTYDYTMPGESNAGPNSPLRGSPDLFDNDIVKNIADLTTHIPSQKLLLGIPFYGYQWVTNDDAKYSPAIKHASVASFERIQTMLNDQTLSLLWDRNTLTPYGIATSSAGVTSQIYFDNDTSLKLKLDFVKSARLGGIAIWALGYEGQGSWVWSLIHDTLS